MGVNIPTTTFSHRIKRITSKIALALLKGLAVSGRLLARVFCTLAPLGTRAFQLLSRFILLPVYSFLVLSRLRLAKVFASARGLLFFIFTNRYVFHLVLLLVSLPAIVSQLQTKSATAVDAGQHSLLYSLVTQGASAVTEETRRPESALKDQRYLGSETLEAMPAIDYDYSDIDDSLVDHTVPGSLIIRPGTDDISETTPDEPTIALEPDEEPGEPGEPKPSPRKEIHTYTVRPGDTIASIAKRHGVSVGTVMWANDLNARSLIKPGDTLKVLPVSGVLHEVKRGDTLERIAQKYKVSAKNISEQNDLSAKRLAVGKGLIIPGAVPPDEEPAIAKTKTTNGKIAVRTDVPASKIKNKAYDLYQEVTPPKDERSKPANADTDKVPATKLLWPTKLRVINQYYGWKHTGLDIDGDYTDPIYASADGVVEKAGWNSGGYGLMIMIAHDNGMKTRYAHASKLFVKAGDSVKKGQVIAMVGTTGRSTGTHLHYEVYVGGKRRNPLAYTK